MAFARPYSQAERELALAKLNATKPQLPVDPMPTPGPGQYNAASLPGMLASGPAENPLTGGLDQRMGAMQSQLRSLLAQQQFAQAQQGNNYQSLQSILAQPGPQMDLPQRQYLSPEQMGLNGALQFLAAIGGARPQYIQPIQAQQAQQQQRLDQMYQDEYMRRQLQYNAEAQARQAQERAASLKVQQGNEELRSLGMAVPKAEAELNDLAMADERNKTVRAHNQAMEELGAIRVKNMSPVAKLDALNQWALAHPEIPNARDIAFAGQIKDLSTAAQQTANANRTNRTLELQIEALTKSNTLKGLNIDKMRKDLENYDDDRAARLAETWARIDDMHFRQEHYGDTFDSKVIDSEENMLKADEDNFNKFIKEKNDYIQELDNKIALQDPKVSKDYIAALETLKSDAIRARDLAFSEVTRAIFERRQKIKEMRSAIAARAKSSVPPKPPLPKAKTSRSGRPPSLPGEVPPADPTKVIPRNPNYPPDRKGK